MVRLREIPRTAAFAWSPGTELPIVVTGTRAGAVDAEFSDETKLELWDLALDNLEQGVELQPVASISTDSRFHDIAWSPANSEHPRGIIAGALENGSLDLWDAEKLINGDSDAFMSRTTKHTGAIKSLQFNPLKPQILATAGTKGELYIYDVNDISNPFRLGTAAARSDDLECVAWNRKVPHILATGGSGGFVTVWDLKTKKASLTLNNNRKAVGAIAWDPNNATKLLTGTPDDTTPVILLWDLRNSNAPEKILQGHDQGVLSLSWCQQDSELLLSCGKDNRTLCWNPQTGELLGEFPEVTNWTFQTRFNPHNPNLSATASFDGKIAIQTLQNTNPAANPSAQGNADAEDFFTKAQTQPQGASFSLRKAPKWMQRPVGASFGFGGKLVILSTSASTAGQSGVSKISISKFAVDSDIESAAETFEAAMKTGDIRSVCETHMAGAATDEEKADWKVIQTLIAENPRKDVTEYLGFSEDNETNGVDKDVEEQQKNDSLLSDNVTTKKNNRVSTFFSDGVDGGDGDDFLANLASTKGAKTDNPFTMFTESDSTSDRQITKALMLGQFEKAMTVCLKENRMADAFMIANCGGKDLMDKAQAAYLSQASKGPTYLRLLASVIGKNSWDIVYNADLANWKESMATLCTYADPTEFPDLCEALGDRIYESGSRKDASFCFLVGSKLEKVINIWIAELHEAEEAGTQEGSADTSFSVHARSLQNFIEKVTVFRDVTKFQDTEANLTSDWKLSPLYDRYIEYAEIVATHGQLSTAEKYLALLPAQYPAAEVARSRVQLAARSKPAQPQGRQQSVSAARPAVRGRVTPAFQPVQSNNMIPQPPVLGSGYAPSATVPASNPYAPPANPYAPQHNYSNSQPQQPQQQQQRYGSVQQPSTYGLPDQPNFGAPVGPPRTMNSTPTAAPPSRSKDMVNWNDTPMVTKPAISRRGTPAQAPITSPFPNQQNLVMPPSAPPFGGPRGAPTPPPPPPKGSAPPRMASPLSSPPNNAFQQSQRTVSSSSANMYAPPVPQIGQQQNNQIPTPPSIPRGASPYNQPPAAAGPPPSNRYAPAPAAQQQFQQPLQPQMAPPPQVQRGPPPSNPYAPQQSQYGQPGPASQPPMSQVPPPSGGPPPGSRPDTGRSQPSRSATPAAAATKYPPGDRSHIPPNAQQLVGIFGNDMQRVAGKAPPSFSAQVKDTQKRLNILFDHLNNEDLLKPETVERLNTLAQALVARDYETAARLQVDIQRERTDECGTWMVGVKRLISMSKATP